LLEIIGKIIMQLLQNYNEKKGNIESFFKL
jgi:hypothetical protein